jgi:outer membrane immunogenic protein
MRWTLLPAVAGVCVGLTQSAFAADMSVRPVARPAPPPALYNWTGLYFGGHLGGAWTSDDPAGVAIVGTGTGAVGATSGDMGQSSFLGGVQLGYNWQFAPNWVIGIEGDFSWADLSSTQTGSLVTAGGLAIPGTSATFTRDFDWMASLRGRIGYTWDRWMLYFTGGAAWANIDYRGSATVATPATAAVSSSNSTTGWVIGGGVEWAMPAFLLAGDWTARVEYLHYEFDGTTIGAAFAPAPGTATFAFADPSVDVVRFGLNYKFSSFR